MLRSKPSLRPGLADCTDAIVKPSAPAKFTQWMPPSKRAPPPTSAGSSRQPPVRCRFTALR